MKNLFCKLVLFRNYMLLTDENPFTILSHKSKVETGEALSMIGMASLIKYASLYAVTISIMFALANIFISKSPMIVAEAKESIKQKLLLVFVIFSSVSIFNFIKLFLDTAFGWTPN